MKKLGQRNRGPERPPEINIAPLMDMVFILLIFFIVTTVFVEETGIEVQKPT
ncbi:ExbD/TolR family protein, partial [Planctomycetota bacterium]